MSENKYEKILSGLVNILGIVGCVFPCIFMMIGPILVIIYVGNDMLGGMLLLFEFSLCCSIHIISYAVGRFFLGDRYRNTGYVSNGLSLEWPVETPQYIKRNVITNLIEMIVCGLFIAAFIILLCLGLYKTISICGIIFSAIAIIIFWLFYKKEEYIIKNNKYNQ